jgi:hypothetical protein
VFSFANFKTASAYWFYCLVQNLTLTIGGIVMIMKFRNLKIIIYFVFIFLALTNCLCFPVYTLANEKADKTNEAKKAIDAFIADYQKNFPPQDWMVSSTFPPYQQLETYKKVESLGIAIVPVIIDYTQDGTLYNLDFMLGIALGHLESSITRTYGPYDHDPWWGEITLTKWYGGQELAKEHFYILYDKLTIARKNKSDKQRELIFTAIKSAGIFYLPFLIDQIRNGDEELLSVIRDIFNEELANKDKNEILAWWDENQKRYLVPHQNKERFRYQPPFTIIDPKVQYTIEERVDRLYSMWRRRFVVEATAPTQIKSERKCVELGQLIGVENTPQFRFLVDLGKEALPYLFLKLRDEKERFTLPVIEKIAGRKLSPEEIESCIKESEKLVGKPKQPAENQEIKNNNSHHKKEQTKIDQPKKEQPQNNKPNTTDVESKTNTTASAEETASEVKTVVWANLYYRPWESKDGIFRTHARFVALVNGKVILERFKDENTGKTISVDTKILRQVDIDTIEAIRKRYRELKAEGKPLPKGMIFDPL